jgi:terminase large subunit-like protein
MRNKKCALTPQQIKHARSLFADPVLFARYVLGVDLWEREVDILRSVQRNRRTAIKSCHGAGKTFTLAILLLWWLTRHQEGIVLTTSPTLRQVKTQLWSEIHRMVTHTRIPYPKLNQTELKLRGEDNFALGFSTNQGERFQGFHGRAVLLIVDEAPGIEASIWDPIAGTMAGGKVHMIMAGNPTVPSGAFYDAFTRERALWNCITIDAFDSPNLKGLSLEQLLETDPTDGSPLDQNPVPYLVTRRWVYDQFKVWWHGDEGSSPSWMARVRGQFPHQAQNSLIKLIWLERARLRPLQSASESEGASLVAGIDVGGGQSETVVYICESKLHHQRIINFGAWRGADTRGEAVRFLQVEQRAS